MCGMCVGRLVGGSGVHVRWRVRALVRMRAASRGLPNNLSLMTSTDT